ncbi:glycosyltransferase [Methylomonas sp. ZR1]|uniref:glycosyltransferase n=1 Tax=Methylomonas sp. ZR1 TaxID=1797072 RepID=UPI001490CCA3|nr:glycosyltransferase [Methylomonas sp. ZR1]NOV31085.1 glycosyltransferase family 1 protein [Methylomonas sp. ZR1]
MIKHISIFMPTESAFHRRLFGFIGLAFQKQGLLVSGACKLLNETEIRDWVREKKPCAIFEMNRVKDEIPVLHELNILHISWVVDMQGRCESDITGSDITYALDPGWLANFKPGGYLDWMPPGTCVETYFPENIASDSNTEFSFIGHIPQPWTTQELSRVLHPDNPRVTFEMLLKRYSEYMDINTYCEQTHESCVGIIDRIASELLGYSCALSDDIYYDLLIRIKRMSNRTELIDFALRYSESIAIYGSQNWRVWSKYRQYYRRFIENPLELNRVHQKSNINLHDGISFHFRAIDCMASGGLLMWYDYRDGDKYDSYNPGRAIYTRGLSDFFTPQFHYYEFKWLDFDDVYQQLKSIRYQGSQAQKQTLELIKNHHTWGVRAEQILEHIQAL